MDKKSAKKNKKKSTKKNVNQPIKIDKGIMDQNFGLNIDKICRQNTIKNMYGDVSDNEGITNKNTDPAATATTNLTNIDRNPMENIDGNQNMNMNVKDENKTEYEHNEQNVNKNANDDVQQIIIRDYTQYLNEYNAQNENRELEKTLALTMQVSKTSFRAFKPFNAKLLAAKKARAVKSSKNKTPYEAKSLFEKWVQLCKEDDVYDFSYLNDRKRRIAHWETVRTSITINDSPDLEIKIGDKYFCCQSILFEAYTDYFRKYSPIHTVELPADKVDADSFIQLYNWMLNPAPVLERKGLLDLINVATVLRAKKVVDQCWALLDNAGCYNESAAFILFLEARDRKIESVCTLMLARISKCFLSVVACKEFVNFSPYHVRTLFESNMIGVHSEIEVFYAAVLWITADWPYRNKYAARIMAGVRFRLLPPWFLVSLLYAPEPEVLSSIVDGPIKTMVYDAMAQPKLKQQRPAPCGGITICNIPSALPTRLWIYDEKCPYYDLDAQEPAKALTFDSFIKYMFTYREDGQTRWQTIHHVVDGNEM